MTSPAPSQSSSSNELSEYTNAVARVDTADRLAQLERFSMSARPGPLKVEALEFVMWEFIRNRNLTHALTWANELAACDKDNSLALALISNNLRNSPATKSGELLATARRGLDALPQLQRPLGMSHTDFAGLRQQAESMLAGTAGWAELQRKDHSAARSYLREAVNLDPNNAQNVYALALADLEGANTNLKEGYWYLAKAVNLSQGTPQGVQIAQFARAHYLKEGGNLEGWQRFLAATAPSSPSGARVYVASSVSSSKPSASASVAASVPATNPPPSKPNRVQPAPSVWADNTTPEPPVIRKHRPTSASGPISLGILIETSLTDKEHRASVVDGLTDMVRHMGDDDEVFILTYDRNLVFQQDLTSDPHQIEEAMENIKPQKGAVLDDAIAFAAGHLARIARHPNRMLLVISDGRNVDSHSSPLQISAEINAAGVRIYCIGMDVSETERRYRLQALSSSTGGRSDFINDPRQFRNATKDIAQNMGVDFRF